jgi:SAM-dependent methyltransferase
MSILEHVDCNLCGSDRQNLAYEIPDEVYFPDEWFSVVECDDCGLGFVNPRPSAEGIARHYPKSFYDGFEKDHQSEHLHRYEEEAKIVIENSRSSSGLLLDVGCAHGGFPRHMKALGWEVEGLEISTQTIPITDFPVYSVPLSELEMEPARYDAVTAWAVLEHVHDPMAYFAKAARIIKKGGIFVFLVPNFDSLDSRFLFSEDVPRHLYFFTAACIREYLVKNGFELIEARYSDKIYSTGSSRWLAYYWHRLLGRPFNWEDAQHTRHQFFKEHGLKPTWLNTARYAFTVPLYVLGRLLLPIRKSVSIMRKRYGVVTYVARRL